MARRLAPGPRGEHGVVPYLQPRAHKCILTDAFESRARPRGPVTRRIGTRVHLPILLPYAMHKYPGPPPPPQQCPTHTCACTHIIHERTRVCARATSRGKQRTALATLFHEHNLHYRAMQAVNSGAQVAVLTLDLLAASAFEYF